MEPKLRLLKKYVLLKSSITALTPSDCKKLSVLISKAVNKNVSETTLKRLYGFAEAKHNFSRYTITALCQYLGKESWEDFCSQLDNQSETEEMTKWEELIYKAKTTSNYTVTNIKNKSSIPFEFTISREFLEKDFNHFYHQNYTFCSVVAQSGFGKSIMLAHLADKFFLNSNAEYKEDMCWFITPAVLSGLEQNDFNFELWFNAQIGNTQHQKITRYLAENCKDWKGKIIIIIDGFDEIAIKKDVLINLVNSLADFVFSNADNDRIKLLLSMRTITWLRFYEKIRHSSHIKSKWFSSSYVIKEDSSNVPPLTDKEIDTIITKFLPHSSSQINPQVKDQLKFPFYIHIYYQLLKEGNDVRSLVKLTFYELVSNYVHYKINLSRHYTEKVILLKKIIQLSQQTQKGNLVYKADLLNDIILFKDAYDELIYDGILIEEKQYGEIIPEEIIRFQQTHVFEYFLFIEMVERNNRVIDEKYLQTIHEEYEKSSLRLKLLQWTVRYAIINGNAEALKNIVKTHLVADDKKHLLFFIAEMLERKSEYKNPVFHKIKSNTELQDLLLTELLNIDFTTFCYKDTLKSLRKSTSSGYHKLIYTSLLAYIAFFELDIPQLRIELDELKNIKNFDKKLLFNQIDAFKLIYYKLSGDKDDDEHIITTLDRFNQGYLVFTQNKDKGSMNLEDIISYVSVCLVNVLYGEENNLISAVSGIYQNHPDIYRKRNGFTLYVLIVSAFVNLRLDLSSVQRILRHITLIKSHIKDESCSFSYVMLCLVMTIYNTLLENHEQALIYAEEGLSISKIKNICTFEAVFLNILTNIYANQGDTERTEYMAYRLHCLLEEKNTVKNSLDGFFAQLRTQNTLIR